MITRWIFEVEIKLNKSLTIYNLGSVFHGALMEKLSDELKEFLHNDTRYSPLKQRLYTKENRSFWEIVSLNSTLEEELNSIFTDEFTLFLKHHQLDAKLSLISKDRTSQNQIVTSVYSKEKIKKYFNISILTPMSFKTNGMNDIFPDLRKIFRSAMLQFDSFSSNHKLYDIETLDYLNECVRIVNYRLRSTKFYLEGTKIPSFIGTFTIKINAPLPVLQLVDVLLKSANYTGIGVKTSLGMGKIELNNL